MSNILWERSLRVAASPPMRSWVQSQANLGLAPRTIDAYSRAIEDSLAFSRPRVISREAVSRESMISLNVRSCTDAARASTQRGGACCH